jgi:hypothetical protein
MLLRFQNYLKDCIKGKVTYYDIICILVLPLGFYDEIITEEGYR